MKKDTLLLSNVHNEQHVANHQLNAIVLNASQEQAMPHPKEDGGFYVSATACRSNRPETGQYYLFYDASCQEIHYTHHTKDDYKQAILHSHPGLSRGNIGEVQLSAGSGIFKSHKTFLESSKVKIIVFSDPKLLPLIPLLPSTPANGAVIVLEANLAITSPLLTFVLKLIGSNNSFFLIL